MGKAYSLDLRQRICAYICEGHSASAAGKVFGVSASTALRIAKQHRATGDIAPKRQGRPMHTGKLAAYMEFVTELVGNDPDITLHELVGALEEAHGLRVQPSSIHRALRRAGYSYKKRLYRAGA